uniref:Uncharacterized protein n=1 Tax=Acrobeloides nanus TaxID=290746 RepID=A0A914DYX4_9BILA
MFSKFLIFISTILALLLITLADDNIPRVGKLEEPRVARVRRYGGGGGGNPWGGWGGNGWGWNPWGGGGWNRGGGWGGNQGNRGWGGNQWNGGGRRVSASSEARG